MSFFRQSLKVSSAQIRLPTPDDHASVERLLQRADERSFAQTPAELAALFDDPLGALMLIGDELVGLLLAGLAEPPVAWIRAVAFDSRLRSQEALLPLLDRLHTTAGERGLRQIYYIGDDWSSSWIYDRLLAAGYQPDEEVLSYEKRSWGSPPAGNQALSVRQVQAADLALVGVIDSAAFASKWIKPSAILSEALRSAGLFLLAESGSQPVGYCYLTLHYGGRLAHLVRIAVLPAAQGQGVGSRLLAECVEFCRQRRIEVFSLNTQSSNPARRLYERFGFEATGDRQIVLRHDIAK